jgi:hypothetical protein
VVLHRSNQSVNTDSTVKIVMRAILSNERGSRRFVLDEVAVVAVLLLEWSTSLNIAILYFSSSFSDENGDIVRRLVGCCFFKNFLLLLQLRSCFRCWFWKRGLLKQSQVDG